MKRIYFFCLLILSVFMLSACVSSGKGSGPKDETIWTLGKENNSYMEFALAPDWGGFLKEFPVDPVVKIGKVNTRRDFPWIFPGIHDEWAGGVDHTYTIEFDLNKKYLEDDDDSYFEFHIGAAGHWGTSQMWEVNLNGTVRNVQIMPGGRSDDMLLDPTKANFTIYRLPFLRETLRPTDNRLTITNSYSSWTVFDVLRFVRIQGEPITAISLVQRPVLSRGEDGSTPSRELQIQFPNRILTKKTPLQVKVSQEGEPEKTYNYELDPQLLLLNEPITVPIINPDKDANVTAIFMPPDSSSVRAAVKLTPVRKWEVHIIHQTHLDIGFTDFQDRVMDTQIENIYDSLRFIDETKDYPEDARFKFHLEGMWAVDEFFLRASDEDKERFINAAKQRDLHLDGLYAQIMSGMYNDEELYYAMNSAAEFARKYGITIDSAMTSDLPGWSWGMISSLAHHGIKYLSAGSNIGNSGNVFDWADKPFYMVSPSGLERVLCMIHLYGYYQFHGIARGTPLDMNKILGYLRRMHLEQYPYDVAILRYSIERDNGPPNRVLSDSIRDWNEKYYWPKMILSRTSDGMKELEERYGNDLPVVQADLGGFWEEGANSTAIGNIRHRNGRERLLQAETMWSMLRPEAYPHRRFHDAWIDSIMYGEHTWGAYNSWLEPESEFVIGQERYKQEYAIRLETASGDLLNEVLPSSGSVAGSSHTIFNTLSWEHGGYAVLQEHPAANAYINLNRTVLPIQKLKNGTSIVFVDPIPALSFAVIEETNQTPASASLPFTADERTATFSNGLLTFRIDQRTGSITSLKRTGSDHEWVKPGDDGNIGLNDYLYILYFNPRNNRERVNGGIKISVEDIGPWVMNIRVESRAPNTKSFIRFYRLYANSDRLEISNTIDKLRERRPERTLFGFPFNMENPVWRYDTNWAVPQVETEQHPVGNRDFYSVQRFMNMSNDRLNVDWITLDAPFVQFTPIFFYFLGKEWPEDSRPKWSYHINPNGTIYNWVCGNHWNTNYKAFQEGLLTFRYVIRPQLSSYDAGSSQRFAREMHQPLITAKGSLPVTPQSLFSLSNKDVVATSVRAAKNGRGYVIRLFNATPAAQTTALNTRSGTSLYLSNALEDRLGSAARSLSFVPWEIKTLRVE